jgi:hypothetical protein
VRVLLEPPKRASDDHFVKLENLPVGGLDLGHAILSRGLAVNLGDARLVKKFGTVDRWLGNLLQDFVVCARAKEVFWGLC